MDIRGLKESFTICKITEPSEVNMTDEYWFLSKTDEELSLVCQTSFTPKKAIERDDGWRAFRIQGVLDFSLVGVLAKIAAILAEDSIGIFVVSTYNTDYVLVKEENFNEALEKLLRAGYRILQY